MPVQNTSIYRNNQSTSPSAQTGLTESRSTTGTLRPSNVRCELTGQIPQDPVCTADGRLYERTAITQHWERYGTDPRTGRPVLHAERQLFPIPHLAEALQLTGATDSISLAHLARALPEETQDGLFVCPLSHARFMYPVRIVETGHVYEYAYLRNWFQANPERICPNSRRRNVGEIRLDERVQQLVNRMRQRNAERPVSGLPNGDHTWMRAVLTAPQPTRIRQPAVVTQAPMASIAPPRQIPLRPQPRQRQFDYILGSLNEITNRWRDRSEEPQWRSHPYANLGNFHTRMQTSALSSTQRVVNGIFLASTQQQVGRGVLGEREIFATWRLPGLNEAEIASARRGMPRGLVEVAARSQGAWNGMVVARTAPDFSETHIAVWGPGGPSNLLYETTRRQSGYVVARLDYLPHLGFQHFVRSSPASYENELLYHTDAGQLVSIPLSGVVTSIDEMGRALVSRPEGVDLLHIEPTTGRLLRRREWPSLNGTGEQMVAALSGEYLFTGSRNGYLYRSRIPRDAVTEAAAPQLELLNLERLSLPSMYLNGTPDRRCTGLAASHDGQWLAWLGEGNGIGLFHVTQRRPFVLLGNQGDSMRSMWEHSAQPRLHFTREGTRSILEALVDDRSIRVELPEG